MPRCKSSATWLDTVGFVSPLSRASSALDTGPFALRISNSSAVFARRMPDACIRP
jgi:hypothetical protein